MSEHARLLFQKAKALFKDAKLDPSNVLKFLEFAMEAVELEELSGAQKKELVIEAIKIAIDEMIPDEEEYKVMETYVTLFLTHTIDELIEVNNGKLKVNPKRSKFYKCFECCSGLFRRLPCARAQAPVQSPVPAPAPVVPAPAPVVPAPAPAPVPEPTPAPAPEPTPAPAPEPTPTS